MPAFKDSLARITDIGAFTDGIPLKAACCRSPMPHLDRSPCDRRIAKDEALVV